MRPVGSRCSRGRGFQLADSSRTLLTITSCHATRWREWKQYTTRGGQRPGPIDNSGLLQDSLDDTSDTITLRRGVMERTDYYTLGPEAWDQMAKWYGGGPVIKRQAFANRGQVSSPAGTVLGAQSCLPGWCRSQKRSFLHRYCRYRRPRGCPHPHQSTHTICRQLLICTAST